MSLARVVASFLAVISVAPLATADEFPPIELEWSAPEGCPTAEYVVARVKALLHRAEVVREPVAVHATIADEGEGFRLEIVTAQHHRTLQRTLRATSCEELANAAALIVALRIDPSLHTRGEPDSAAFTRETRASERTERHPSREKSSEPSLRPHLRVVAGPVADFGSLPGAAPGLELGAGVELGGATATLSGVWFPYAKHNIVEASGGAPEKGGTFRLAAGLARFCYRPVESVWVAACGGMELGILRGEGYGTATEIMSDVFWAALGPGLETGFSASERVVVRGAGDVLFPLRRPNFVLEGVGDVHEPNAVSVRLAIGLLLRFP